MRHARSLIPALALSLAAGQARAQQACNANGCAILVDASAAINTVASLTLSAAATNIGTLTAAHFAAGGAGQPGFVNTTGPSITVKSNRPYRVQVSAASGVTKFTYAGAASPQPAKPLSDLKWGTDGVTYPHTLAAPADLVGTSPATGGSTPRTIFIQTLWRWTADPPGTYSVQMAFTLVAP